eukprot:227636-Prorocentrum_minimum.AAC.2
MGVLVKEPAASMFRFWLAACVEAFLRGSQGCEQVCHCHRLCLTVSVTVTVQPRACGLAPHPRDRYTPPSRYPDAQIPAP